VAADAVLEDVEVSEFARQIIVLLFGVEPRNLRLEEMDSDPALVP